MTLPPIFTAETFALLTGLRAPEGAFPEPYRIAPLTGTAHTKQMIAADKEIERAREHVVSGADRADAWERCWRSVREHFIQGLNPTLAPPYLHERTLRIDGQYVLADPRLLAAFQSALVRALALEHFRGCQYVIELGCGAGFNLLNLARAGLDAEKFIGYDRSGAAARAVWAAATRLNLPIEGWCAGDLRVGPPPDIGPESAILTCGAMEQLGDAWRPLLAHLIASRPAVVVHIEPLEELYDQDADFLDYLALRYHRARGYLSGYLTALRDEAAAGRIKILAEHRTRFGSAWNDGYSYIVWRPK